MHAPAYLLARPRLPWNWGERCLVPGTEQVTSTEDYACTWVARTASYHTSS